jgi:hypothetical protein
VVAVLYQRHAFCCGGPMVQFVARRHVTLLFCSPVASFDTCAYLCLQDMGFSLFD